jgi:hypothetical protein
MGGGMFSSLQLADQRMLETENTERRKRRNMQQNGAEVEFNSEVVEDKPE